MADIAEKTLTLAVDTAVYPLDAVQAAAYSFTDRAYVRIARSGKGLSVSLKPKTGAAAAGLADEFHNELLHETLRRRVSEANKKIREFIVTKALVSAQVPSAAPDTSTPGAQEPCPECEAEARAAASKKPVAPAPAVDPDLEKEIEKLLKEIEKSGPGGGDPLNVAVPWEKRYGKDAAKKAPAKPAAKKKGKKA